MKLIEETNLKFREAGLFDSMIYVGEPNESSLQNGILYCRTPEFFKLKKHLTF